MEDLQDALRKPWIGVFMDGRNEHGTHLLVMSQRNASDEMEREVKSMLEDMGDGYAEGLFAKAESMGYAEGNAIVLELHVETAEGYTEIVGISEVLTRAFYGSPDEQGRELTEDPANG
jgi:hypothetical protein